MKHIYDVILISSKSKSRVYFMLVLCQLISNMCWWKTAHSVTHEAAITDGISWCLYLSIAWLTLNTPALKPFTIINYLLVKNILFRFYKLIKVVGCIRCCRMLRTLIKQQLMPLHHYHWIMIELRRMTVQCWMSV